MSRVRGPGPGLCFQWAEVKTGETALCLTEEVLQLLQEEGEFPPDILSVYLPFT